MTIGPRLAGVLLLLVLIAVSLTGCQGDPAEGMRINQTAAGCAASERECYS